MKALETELLPSEQYARKETFKDLQGEEMLLTALGSLEKNNEQQPESPNSWLE